VLSPPFSTSNGDSPKVFGRACFVHIHGQTQGKFDSRAPKCVFVGYFLRIKGINVIIPQCEKMSQWMLRIRPTQTQTPRDNAEDDKHQEEDL
jgi:hypothetical protein